MLWHKFDKCGVYYYSDLGEQECASYIGIVAVKQKSENHVLVYDEEKRNFGIDLVTMETGDIIWWKWTPPAEITIQLIDYSFLFDKKIDSEKCRIAGKKT
jgi:hypothetical protein